MYYKTLIVLGVEWPITSDGLIVNPRRYQKIDVNWEWSLQIAWVIYAAIFPIINELNSSGLSVCTKADAWKFVTMVWDTSLRPSLDELYECLRKHDGVTFPDDLVLINEAYLLRLGLDIFPPSKMVATQPNITGYVYIIQSSTGAYKIGRARNVKNRLKTFEVKLPFEVELLHTIECADYYSAERELHARYASKRVNGEWFKLDVQDVAYIKSIERM